MGKRFKAMDARGERFLVRLFEDIDPDTRNLLQRTAVPYQHPHLGTFVESGVSPEHLWLARSLPDGPDLDTVLQDGPLSADRVIQLVREVLSGLNALHQESFVHQNWRRSDLALHEGRWLLCEPGFYANRPDPNIVIHPLVMDFPYYAPEQMSESEFSCSGDLYALGSLAFHCLTGERPFYAESAMEHFARMLTEEAVVRDHCPDAPESLVQALEILLRREPSRRDPQAVRELLMETGRGAPSRAGEVEGFLSTLRVAGRNEGSGRFTLDPAKALVKLRDFQFERPHHFLFPLIAGLVAMGASRVDIKSDQRRIVLKTDGRSIEQQELQDLFVIACASEQKNPVARLGFGVAGALGAGATRVTISSGGWRAKIGGLEKIRVKSHRGSGLTVEIRGSVVTVEPPSELFRRLYYSPIPITWNERPLCHGRRLPELVRVVLGEEEFVVEGGFEQERPGLYIAVDGLTYQLSGFFEVSGAVVVLAGPWKLSLSYQAIQGDRRRRELEQIARRALSQEAVRVVSASPVDLRKKLFYQYALKKVEDQRLRAKLHERIVAACEMPPLDDPYLHLSTSLARRSSSNELVAQSCEFVFRSRLPLAEKAARILTSPDYLTGARNWAEIEELSEIAFSQDVSERFRFKLRAFVRYVELSPSLDQVTELFRHLELIRMDARSRWDELFRCSVQSLAREYPQDYLLRQSEWLKLLPVGFTQTETFLSMVE